jgi:AcrR family transcriptional regulator
VSEAATTDSPWPTADQRSRERQSKRDAVLSAAVDLFNERGFTATSIDDVAKRLGVTKPTIYHYFPTKQDILLACLMIGVDTVQRAVASAGPGEGDGQTGFDTLRGFLLAYAESATSRFTKCVTLTNDYDLTEPNLDRFKKIKRDVHRSIMDMIERGRRDGSIEAADTAIAALAVEGALNTISRWFTPESDEDSRAVAEAMVTFLMRSFIPLRSDQSNLSSFSRS